MVGQITNDVKEFMLVFLLYNLMFTYVFMIYRQEDDFEVSWQNIYRLAYGDFEEEYADDYERILFFGTTIFLNLILFNMVIALMGDIFARVAGKQEVEDIYEKLLWIKSAQIIAFWDRTPCLVYLHSIKNATTKKQNQGVVVKSIKQVS